MLVRRYHTSIAQYRPGAMARAGEYRYTKSSLSSLKPAREFIGWLHAGSFKHLPIPKTVMGAVANMM